MSDGKPSLRSRLPELAIEAAMVVFAVLVALGVEEWREERQLREFADRARGAVAAEVGANLEELRSTGAALDSTATLLSRVVRENDVSLLTGGLALVLPDFSAAAWRTAQTSQASAYLDYDWMIEVSRAYELIEFYSSVATQVVEAMSVIIMRAPTVEGLNSISGRLVVLTGLHGQLEERLEALGD